MPYSKAMTETARRLRREATDAERKLWELLRGRRCGGRRFLRQVPAGHFVLDFYCAPARLAIEVDGGVHDDPEVARRDRERETVLRDELRISVLRLSNNDVLAGDEAALKARILEAVAQAEQQAPPLGQRPARRQ